MQKSGKLTKPGTTGGGGGGIHICIHIYVYIHMYSKPGFNPIKKTFAPNSRDEASERQTMAVVVTPAKPMVVLLWLRRTTTKAKRTPEKRHIIFQNCGSTIAGARFSHIRFGGMPASWKGEQERRFD